MNRALRFFGNLAKSMDTLLSCQSNNLVDPNRVLPIRRGFAIYSTAPDSVDFPPVDDAGSLVLGDADFIDEGAHGAACGFR